MRIVTASLLARLAAASFFGGGGTGGGGKGSRSAARQDDVGTYWHTSASGYRPAQYVAFPRQRIPRRIVQLGRSFEAALKSKHGRMIEDWWVKNPDYSYAFFNDSHARAYVEARGAADEVSAYLALKQGAQRADVFRMVWMKYEGGVYADLDSSCINPLRLGIPPQASAFTGQSWSFEFLAYEPGHPIIIDGLRQSVSNVLGQVEELKKPASERKNLCRGARRCVVTLTGPGVYHAGVGDATHRLGCENKARVFTGSQCRNSQNNAMRRVHVCGKVPGIKEGQDRGQNDTALSLGLPTSARWPEAPRINARVLPTGRRRGR